jgi:peptidoglycan/LPS O-acetylase OafA/YrhL
MNQPILRILAAGGLAVDAYVHADLAGQFDGNGATLTEGTLFRLQAALAALAALWVLLSGRRPAAAFALLISASALGAVLLYRYVDVGALGPLPNMYEPIWYTEKTVTAIAEAVAVVASVALLLVRTFSPSERRGTGSHTRHAGRAIRTS